MQTNEVIVPTESLQLNEREIWVTMGAREGAPDDFTLSLIAEVQEELLSIAKPKYCYTEVNEVPFKYGRIIADALKDGSRYAIMVATAGREVDDLLHQYKESDIVKAFVADTIASEIAEATSRVAIEAITTTLTEGEEISNPYSPGYCGWVLREQSKLFAHFEGDPCGVTLNDSCLMLPVKSISSVLAIGKNVVKAPYGCAVCTKMDCYKKRS